MNGYLEAADGAGYREHIVSGPGESHYGGTQMASQTMDGYTMHSDGGLTTNVASSSSGFKPNPDVDVWGLLRRKGGEQEETLLRHRLKDGRRDTFLIGRSQTCDVNVFHKNVSSAHCKIYCDYSQARLRVFIEDCSANGTFVNDSLTRLTRGERMELKSGDEIFLVNPRLASMPTPPTSKLKEGATVHQVVADAAFLFVNIRERVVNNREKSLAPTLSQQDAMNTANTRHVEDLYVIGDQIGSGMSGTVHLCIERATGAHYAVKIIDTKKFALSPGLSPSDLREEAAMMSNLNHPHIISIKDTFETNGIIFIVMELVKGGDLFDKIVEKGKYTEDGARSVMRKVLSAVLYLHSKEIIHRDLKPENILLVDPNNDEEVKITDFGLAKRTNQEGLKTFCGTPQYFAPEVLLRKHTVAGVGSYGTSADMWSLGVVLYILLSGAFPFDEDNLLDQIQHAHYSVSGPEWSNVSDAAKALVRSLLTLQPDKRVSVEQALSHPWLTGEPYIKPATNELGSFLSGPQNSKTSGSNSNSNTKGKSSTGRVSTTGAANKKRTQSKSQGIRRKQTSGNGTGSQGILQMLSAQSIKTLGTDLLANPVPQSKIASMAVAAAYGSQGCSWSRSLGEQSLLFHTKEADGHANIPTTTASTDKNNVNSNKINKSTDKDKNGDTSNNNNNNSEGPPNRGGVAPASTFPASTSTSTEGGGYLGGQSLYSLITNSTHGKPRTGTCGGVGLGVEVSAGADESHARVASSLNPLNLIPSLKSRASSSAAAPLHDASGSSGLDGAVTAKQPPKRKSTAARTTSVRKAKATAKTTAGKSLVAASVNPLPKSINMFPAARELADDCIEDYEDSHLNAHLVSDAPLAVAPLEGEDARMIDTAVDIMQSNDPNPTFSQKDGSASRNVGEAFKNVVTTTGLPASASQGACALMPSSVVNREGENRAPLSLAQARKESALSGNKRKSQLGSSMKTTHNHKQAKCNASSSGANISLESAWKKAADAGVNVGASRTSTVCTSTRTSTGALAGENAINDAPAAGTVCNIDNLANSKEGAAAVTATSTVGINRSSGGCGIPRKLRIAPKTIAELFKPGTD